MDLVDKYLGESDSYTDKIAGVPKNAFDFFNKYKKEFSTKELGLKGFNVSKVSIGTSALSDKQRAQVASKIMGDKFDHVKQTKELEKLIKIVKDKWSEIQTKAHMEKYGEKPSFGSYKVSGVGDSSYSDTFKKQLRTLAHMQTSFKNALIGHKKAK